MRFLHVSLFPGIVLTGSLVGVMWNEKIPNRFDGALWTFADRSPTQTVPSNASHQLPVPSAVSLVQCFCSRIYRSWIQIASSTNGWTRTDALNHWPELAPTCRERRRKQHVHKPPSPAHRLSRPRVRTRFTQHGSFIITVIIAIVIFNLKTK